MEAFNSILLVSSEQALPNSSGVRYARLLCGRSPLYSTRQPSIFSFAFDRRRKPVVVQTFIAKPPFEAFDMPFCIGRPG
jgi:hypothetical protein